MMPSVAKCRKIASMCCGPRRRGNEISPPTSRSPCGAVCFTTRISRRRSSIGCSSADACFIWTAHRCVPSISALTIQPLQRHPQSRWSEYPEFHGRNHRNAQLGRWPSNREPTSGGTTCVATSHAYHNPKTWRIWGRGFQRYSGSEGSPQNSRRLFGIIEDPPPVRRAHTRQSCWRSYCRCPRSHCRSPRPTRCWRRWRR